MSLWSSNLLDGIDDITPPADILTTQGEILGDMTNNFVIGHARKIVYKNSKSSDFHYVFRLEASTIDYNYELFRIHHPVTLYPLTLEFDDDTKNIKDELEFLEELKRIFSLPETERIIRSILVQTSYNSPDDVLDDIPF